MQGRGGGGLAIKATPSCLAASHRLAQAQAAEGASGRASLWLAPSAPWRSLRASVPLRIQTSESRWAVSFREAPNLSLKHAAGASYLSIQCPRPKAKVLRVVGAGPR